MIAAPLVALALAAPPRAVTFEEAVRLAELHAVNAQVSALEVERAEGLLREARAGSLPAVAGNGAYTRLDHDRTLGGRIIISKDQLSGNVTATVPLVAPSRWAQWASASEALDVAHASEADVRRAVALTAARAYLAVVAARRQVAVQERSRETAQAHYDFAQKRLQGGVGSRLDAVRADQQLAQAEVLEQSASLALDRAREALGVAAGADAPLDSADDPNLPATPPNDVAREIDARPDVKAARLKAEAAADVANRSWVDYLPSLLGAAEVLTQRPASLTTPEQGWQAQLLLSVPLFDGLQRSGQAKQRDALAKESQAQVDGLLRVARSEVRSAVVSLQDAEAALTSARRAASRAEEGLKLATEAYEGGITNELDVIDAQRVARDAETSAIVAEDGVRQARLDLLAALGRFP